MLGCCLCVWGHAGANRQLYGVCRSSGDVHGSAQWTGEKHWCGELVERECLCVAHPSPQLLTCCSLFPGISVQNPEWLTPAITLLSLSMEVTLCREEVWICVCVCECLHHLFPLLQLRVRFFCPLCSALTGTCGVMSSTALHRFFSLENINTWAQVYQCSAGSNLFWQ